MKKAHYDKETNALLGWYCSEIHATIPNPTLEVTDEEWQVALSVNANYVDLNAQSVIYKDNRSIDDIEQCRINSIKDIAKGIIYAKYDQEDQNNLAFLPELNAEKIAAIEFINHIRTISKAAISARTPSDEINWGS